MSSCLYGQHPRSRLLPLTAERGHRHPSPAPAAKKSGSPADKWVSPRRGGVSWHLLAVVAERVGRLKLNGRLRTYSPLSRFVELEFLAMGIEGKKLLWGTLRDLAGLSRLPDIDFDDLIKRAERQRADLEPFRVRVGKEVLAVPVP